MTNEEYIEHEVKIRLHEHQISNLDKKINWLIGINLSGIGLVISSIAIPIALHFYKLA